MRKTLFALVLIALALVASPANALYEGLQCVPFARALTGVTIFGDAHTWWNQAAGKYQPSNAPHVGPALATSGGVLRGCDGIRFKTGSGPCRCCCKPSLENRHCSVQLIFWIN